MWIMDFLWSLEGLLDIQKQLMELAFMKIILMANDQTQNISYLLTHLILKQHSEVTLSKVIKCN